MVKIGVILPQRSPCHGSAPSQLLESRKRFVYALTTKLNKAILRVPYPTFTIKEVAAKTAGAQYFSVLSVNSRYWQVQLDEQSSKLCTFNAPWGHYRYTRLPFGIKTAGDIFAEEMNEILKHLEGL